jgi:hypothetical protein
MKITPRIVKLIAEIDEFKGYWKGMERLSAQCPAEMSILVTIESIGSSTRIEGAALSNREVPPLLEGLERRSFRSRDEQEVAGYAESFSPFVQGSKPALVVEHAENIYRLSDDL